MDMDTRNQQMTYRGKALRRILSLVLAMAMVLPCGLTARAAETCEHHTEHTPECGYRVASPGAACKYDGPCDKGCADSDGDGRIDHARDCAYTRELEKDLCDQGCTDTDGDGFADHGESCPFVQTKGIHAHSDSCGYKEADAGAPCAFQCEQCAAVTAEALAEPSPETTAPAATAEATVPETTVETTVPATRLETTVPETTEATAPETTAETVPETTAATVPETTAETVPETTAATVPEETPVQQIEALIAALPQHVTEDNREAVTAQLQEILALYTALTEAEQEQVDMTPCVLLQMELDAANVPQPLGGADEANATPVTASDTEWNGGFYKVTENITLTDRVKVNGTVTLILEASCKLTASKGIAVANSDQLTITGDGELEATGSDYGNAGIGGGSDISPYTSGTIIIESGTITANGGEWAAGIGGGASRSAGGSGGTIIIKGGTVNATGGNGAAGIGGGSGNGAGGNITISGGTVIAIGDGNGGAGIGGGAGGGAGGDVTISGGTVTANGGWQAAGIGGGSGRGAGGNVTISGGTVIATGNANSISGSVCSGIGGGSNGSGGKFSTGTNGSAWIVATGGSSYSSQGNGIGDTSSLSDWSGIIFQNGAGQVYTQDAQGLYQLHSDVTIPDSATLTIPSDTRLLVRAPLTVPAGTEIINNGNLNVMNTLTVNGTVTNNAPLYIESGGTLTGTGSLTGEGKCQTSTVTTDMIFVDPIPAYSGENRSEDIKKNVRLRLLEHDFEMQRHTFVDGVTCDAWTLSVAPNGNSVTEYIVTYQEYVPAGLSGDPLTVTKTVTLGKSGTTLTASSDQTECVYADTITIHATVKASGVAPAAETAALLTAADGGRLRGDPQPGQVAVYQGDTQVSEAKTPEASGSCTLTVDTTALGAGEHPLTVKYIETTVMAGAEETVTVTVNPKALTPTITGTAEKVYDGTTAAPAGLSVKLAGVVGNDDVTAAAASYAYDSAGAGDDKTITAMGITLGGTAAGNYTLSSDQATTTGRITKSQPSIAFNGYPDTATYSGTALENPTADQLTISGAAYTDVQFSWTQDGTVVEPVNVGAYTLTATIPDTASTNETAATFRVTIEPKAVADPTAILSPNSFVYDGTEKEPGVTLKDGELEIPSSEYTVAYSSNVHVGTGATVTITDRPGGNYTIPEKSVTFSITQASISGAAVTVDRGYTYDGTAHTPEPTVTLDGKTLVKDTDYTVTYADNVNAGDGNIRVTGKGNYTGEAASTFPIEKRAVTAAVSADDKTYDGTVDAALTARVDTGVAGETITLTGLKGRFEDADAGEEKAVTVDASGAVYGGSANIGNYTVTVPTAVKASITPAGIPVPAAAQGLAYNGREQTGVEPGTGYTLQGNTAKNAGSYQATATLDGNHIWKDGDTGAKTIPWTIAPKNVTAAITASGGTYTGKPFPAQAVIVEDVTVPVTLTYSPGGSAPTEAGTYTVTASIRDGNYCLTGPVSKTFTIAKADPMLTVSESVRKTYGDADFTLPVTRAGDGAMKYASGNENVAAVDETGKIHIVGAGEAEITLSVAESGNHTAGEAKARLTVQPKAITVTITPGGGVFGQTVTPAQARAEGLMESDAVDVTLTYTREGETAGSDDVPAQVGAYTVTASIDHPNYILTGNTTAPFRIRQPITVKIGDCSKTYGEKDPSFSYEITEGSVLDGHPLHIQLKRAAGENAGTYTITAPDADKDNPSYAVTVEPGKLTVKSRDIGDAQVILGPALTANGREQTQTLERVTVVIQGKTVDVTYTVTGNTATRAGGYTMTIQGTGNFTGTCQQLFAIAPAAGQPVDTDSSGNPVLGAGKITVQVDNNATGVALGTSKAAVVGSLDKSVDLTAQELAQVAAGAELKIVLDVTDGVTQTEQKLLSDYAARILGSKARVDKLFDISLYKQLGGQVEWLHKTQSAIRLTVQVPRSLINTDKNITRTFWILRCHNGTVQLLPAHYDGNNRTLSFSTDRFSGYAIVHRDTKNTGGGQNVGGTSPQTGDNSHIELWITVMALSAVGIGAVLIIRRKKKK